MTSYISLFQRMLRLRHSQLRYIPYILLIRDYLLRRKIQCPQQQFMRASLFWRYIWVSSVSFTYDWDARGVFTNCWRSGKTINILRVPQVLAILLVLSSTILSSIIKVRWLIYTSHRKLSDNRYTELKYTNSSPPSHSHTNTYNHPHTRQTSNHPPNTADGACGGGVTGGGAACR